jgi:long-chain fatty acid transport protein
MNNPFALTRISAAVLAALAAVRVANPAVGAGFALQENSGSGLGNAYAGGAAAAEDASTVWFNAAGMARLGSAQAVGALNLIQPSLKFGNSASMPAAQQPLGGEGGNAGSLAAVPNLYVTYPIDARWTLGLGVNGPFGLVSEYDNGWIGRFQGIKSDIKTYNVNPAVSWKATDGVAIGGGVNFQRIEATFTSHANYSYYLLGAAAAGEQGGKLPPGTAAAVALATPGLESGVNVSGSDNTWGWNLGILVDIDKANRIGMHYRSAMKYTVSGTVEFTNPALPASLPPALAPVVGALATAVNGQLYNSGVTSKIKLPEIVNLSYFGNLNPQWDVMADLQYTGWSSIQELTFVRSDGKPLQSTTENFKDAWRVAVGANYRYNDQWLFRGGLAYDQTPVEDAYRTPRLPDADRTWLALGAQYKMNPKLWFDFGAAYVWVRSGSIDDTGSSAGGRPPSVAQNGLVNGTYNNNVVILSGQITYAF